MLIQEKIETTAAFYYIEDDIVYMRAKQDADITLEAAKEGIEARIKLQQGKKMLMLADTSKVWQVSSNARAYSSTPEVDKMNIAMAILAGYSLTTTIIANFFIKFNKPKTPTKIFKNEKDALDWLDTFR